MLKETTTKIMNDEYVTRKTNDYGVNGDCFEIAIRSYLCQRRVHKVKREGAPDIVITRNGQKFHVEIKSACGTVDDTLNADYVIYCPDVDINYPAESQGYVFSKEQWHEFLTGYTGRGQFVRYNKARNVSQIQSFYVSDTVRPKASKPIANYIWETVYELPTLDEFEEEWA